MKCPACGYDSSRISITEVTNIMNSKSSELRKSVKDFSKSVFTIPSETKNNYYKFIIAIKDLPDAAIIEAINDYMEKERYRQMKGFLYVAHVARSLGQNREEMIANERTIYGTNPKKIKL